MAQSGATDYQPDCIVETIFGKADAEYNPVTNEGSRLLAADSDYDKDRARAAAEFRRLQWETYPWSILGTAFLAAIMRWLVVGGETNFTSSSEDISPIDLTESWHAPTAWGIAAAWATYRILKNGLPWGIGTELCCCPFARNLAATYDLQPAGLIRWMYWSSGLIIGTMLIACSLPEVLVRYDPVGVEDVMAELLVTPTFVLWWKLILGFAMVNMHSDMMKYRTLEHNHAHPKGTEYGGFITKEDGALYNGRTRPLSNDGTWRANKAICQVLQVIHWTVWIPVFIQTGRVASRPLVLVALDGGAISLLFTINILRSLCYVFGYNKLFWLVRSRKASEKGRWNFVGEKPGFWEPWVRLLAEPSWKWKRLDEQMAERVSLYADDDPRAACHGCKFTEWTRGRNTSELQLETIKVLQHPKTTCLDNHTKIWIFLTEWAVNSGSATCVLASDIKCPFEKTKLPIGNKKRLGGLQFAETEELFMDDPSDANIGFDWIQRMALGQVSKLNLVDEPLWFSDEFDGIVHMEAVMRQFLPTPSDSWKEMHSDAAMSMLAFGGIGQLYILHVSAFKEQRESPQPPRGPLPLGYKGELPAGTEYVLDLTTMANYDVREYFCRYGGAAFFDKDRNLLGIYCCDLPELNGAVKSTGPPTPKLVLARDNKECWDFVKFSLRSTLISLCTLRDHLVFCHWMISNRVSIASREELGMNHPLRRVLTVFTFRAAAVNFMSATTLMEENMLMHRASAFTSEALTEAIENCVANFQYKPFPEEMKSKKMPNDSLLPLAEDGMLVWDNFLKFFTEYVGEFYADDAAVLADKEVMKYWESLERASIFHKDGDTFHGYGLPELSKKTLIEQLTHTAFWVTGMHEVSGSVVEMFESPRNSATKIARQGPPGPENGIYTRQSMADVQTYFQDLCVIGSTGIPLPQLRSDWTHIFLGDMDPIHPGKNARCKQLHKQLMEDFNATHLQIWERNRNGQGRPRTFNKMDPFQFETSASH